MCEKYKGYGIHIAWNDNTAGFDFQIYGADGRDSGTNELSYFFEENAMAAAKQTVDEMLEGLDQQP